MTAREHVLSIYPDAAENKRYRIAFGATEKEFLIDIVDCATGSSLAQISTTFADPEVIVDAAWELAWSNIQQSMLDKLAEDPEDRRRMEAEHQEFLEYEEYKRQQEDAERDWERRQYEELEEQVNQRYKI